MNPRDALHQQELLKSSMTHSLQREYLEGVMEDVERKYNGPVIKDDKGKITGEVIAEAMDDLLGRAETFYVSADMEVVAEAASHGLDDLDRFTHDMWPTDSGFLYFERGTEFTDVWGRALIINAFAWQRRMWKGHPGTVLFEFATLGDERDALTLSMSPQEQMDMVSRLGSRLMLSGTRYLADGSRVGPSTVPTPERYNLTLDPEVEATLPEQFQVTQAMPATANMDRFFMSLLMLMQQTIARKDRVDLRPRNPKRARRMSVPGVVTIIRLRHEAGARVEGESHVEWAHRWFVRGHWRWQHCGPDYPMAIEVSPGEFRSRIYIAPFIKGPDGAPLKQSKKVNALIR